MTCCFVVGLGEHQLEAWREYDKFFTGYRTTTPVEFRDTPGFVTLLEILNMYTGEGKVFLKIDIEGWEYRVLNDVIAEADRICGLAIEFHDVDLHYARLEEFVKNLPLRIAHVHHNSFAPISDPGTPLALGVTFSSQFSVTTNTVKLPHALDWPSALHHELCEIRFIGS